jgi:hypothetical protein
LNGELVVSDIDIKYENLIVPKMIKVDDMDHTWMYEQLPMTFPPHVRNTSQTYQVS